MPNIHPCVQTQSEVYWRQHGETLRRSSSRNQEIQSCHLWLFHSATLLTAKTDIFKANDEIAEVRQSIVKEMEQANSFAELMAVHMKTLEPIFGLFSYSVEEVSSSRVRLEIDKTVIMSLVEKYPMLVELLVTCMKQFETISETASQCAHVAERVEMDCKVLEDDNDFMDHLEDGEAAPREKSVAIQYDHGELVDPALFCLKAAQEIIASKNVELITLMMRLILETSRSLMASTRESFPAMQDAFEDIRARYLKASDARDQAKSAEDEILRRRNSFSVVK